MPTDRPKITVVLDDALLAGVDRYKDRIGTTSRSKAIYELVRIGLQDLELNDSGAMKMAATYQSLDSHGQEVLTTLSELESKRIRSTNVVELPKRLWKVRYYDDRISAGLGNPVDSPEPEILELNQPPPRHTDYVLQVSGDSMTPMIPDGSLVCIQQTDAVDVGEIAAVYCDGSTFLKKLGHRELISLNRKYKPIQPSDDFRILGRYLGVLPDDSIV